jgi:AcrR family transcriptional regulator
MECPVVSEEPISPARTRTRRAVLAAAARVFAARGFHGASMQAIAEEAGYTQGAIYANFTSKAALFLAVVDERLGAQTAEAHAALAETEESERLDRVNRVGRQRLAAPGGGREALLGLEFLLYAVRDEPELRAGLAERYRAADGATRQLLVHALPALAAAPAGTLDQLVLVHSLLHEGLQVRLLADPDLLAPEAAADLIEQTMHAVGVALLDPD